MEELSVVAGWSIIPCPSVCLSVVITLQCSFINPCKIALFTRPAKRASRSTTLSGSFAAEYNESQVKITEQIGASDGACFAP